MGGLEAAQWLERTLTVLDLHFAGAGKILCLGAHSDDIEIGCGGTVLQLARRCPEASFFWVVFSSDTDERRDEAFAGARSFLEDVVRKEVMVKRFRESFFPFAGEQIKTEFEEIRARFEPDLVFTHYRHDLHQDHKLVSDLTWNTFRQSLILEYEIPKWDGDLGIPNCYMPLPAELAERKVRTILETFESQGKRPWFTADTFQAMLRLRGVESNCRFAEAFHARKLLLGCAATEVTK